MTNEMTEKDLVVVPVDRGWAVLLRSTWNATNTTLDLVASIEGCSTWGEYREIRDDASDDILLCYTDLDPDEDVDDDEPFGADLTEVEDLDRNAMLEAATQDFFESLPDAAFLEGKIDYAELWSWIEHEHRSVVVKALRRRGFTVTIDEG